MTADAGRKRQLHVGNVGMPRSWLTGRMRKKTTNVFEAALANRNLRVSPSSSNSVDIEEHAPAQDTVGQRDDSMEARSVEQAALGVTSKSSDSSCKSSSSRSSFNAGSEIPSDPRPEEKDTTQGSAGAPQILVLYVRQARGREHPHRAQRGSKTRGGIVSMDYAVKRTATPRSC